MKNSDAHAQYAEEVGRIEQPLEEPPAGPRAAEQAAGDGELLPGQHDTRHRHVAEHQEQRQRRDQQQVSFLILEQVGRPRPPTRARRAPRPRLLYRPHHGRRV